MNSKGQAALEYLMTYGWALIVIAIVVGVLVFIVSSPAGNIVCNSSDPAKILVKASQVDNAYTATATHVGTIKLTNLTGGDIADGATCAGSGGFDAVVIGCPTTGWGSGQEVTLIPDAGVAGSYASSAIVIAYQDYATLDRTATITCSGPIVVS